MELVKGWTHKSIEKIESPEREQQKKCTRLIFYNGTKAIQCSKNSILQKMVSKPLNMQMQKNEPESRPRKVTQNGSEIYM